MAQEVRVCGEAVFGEHNRSAAKTVGFDDVGAGVEIFAMYVQDYIWPGAHQVFVAAFERRAAEVLGGEVALLQHRAHGAVEHKDALRQQVAKGSGGFRQITHGAEEWCLLGFRARSEIRS